MGLTYGLLSLTVILAVAGLLAVRARLKARRQLKRQAAVAQQNRRAAEAAAERERELAERHRHAAGLGELALSEWDDARYQTAAEVFEQAIQTARSTFDPVCEGRLRQRLARFHLRAGQFDLGVNEMHAAIELLKTVPSERALVAQMQPVLKRYIHMRDCAARAEQLNSKAIELRYKDEQKALELCEEAVQIAMSGLKPDHWLVARMLCTLGCLRYDNGYTLEAREIWDHAEVIISEWQDKAPDLAKTIGENLTVARNSLGF